MNPKDYVYPNWVRWIAQDADGVVWGYEVEPLQHYQGWYENEVGRSVKITANLKNDNWQDTLHKIT